MLLLNWNAWFRPWWGGNWESIWIPYGPINQYNMLFHHWIIAICHCVFAVSVAILIVLVIDKVASYGVDQLNSCLSNRFQNVAIWRNVNRVINNTIFLLQTSQIGVPRGSELGPILFKTSWNVSYTDLFENIYLL